MTMREEISGEKFDCWTCRHRGEIPGDCHVRCNHPDAKLDAPIIVKCLMTGSAAPLDSVWKRLGITGDIIGIRNGWFLWPMNFDPTWLRNCNGYAEAEEEKT